MMACLVDLDIITILKPDLEGDQSDFWSSYFYYLKRSFDGIRNAAEIKQHHQQEYEPNKNYKQRLIVYGSRRRLQYGFNQSGDLILDCSQI